MEFKLRGEFIELDNLLKVLNMAEHGAEAKRLIQSGEVKVNGQAETRVRCKLHSGDAVEFSGQKIELVS